ncbi:MAG: class I SAM-dependent methyltransferase [Anaerolineae bacterium]
MGVMLQYARVSAPPGLDFIQGDALALPFASSSVNLVICAQVYEHVSDARQLFAEIWRILAPGGACFFSGPNRLFPFEYHWRLPFIHWLPNNFALKLAQVLKRSIVDKVQLRSYWNLRRLLQQYVIDDYTAEMLVHPQDYGIPLNAGLLHWLSHVPRFILQQLVVLAPNFNWLLVKGQDSVNSAAAKTV